MLNDALLTLTRDAENSQELTQADDLLSHSIGDSTETCVSSRIFSPDPGVEITEHPVPADIWQALLRLNPFEPS